MAVTNLQVVETGRAMIGTPYHHLGRVPGVGLDCVGLYVCVAQKLGLRYADKPYYPAMPLHDLYGPFMALMDNVGPVRASWGDWGLFATMPGNPALPTHLAMFTDRGLLHSEGRRGKRRVVEHGYSKYWHTRLLGIYRYPGVTIEKGTELWPPLS